MPPKRATLRFGSNFYLFDLTGLIFKVVHFGTGWGQMTLSGRDRGYDTIAIAQLFQASATLLVVRADSGIETVNDLRGKTVATWRFLDAGKALKLSTNSFLKRLLQL